MTALGCAAVLALAACSGRVDPAEERAAGQAALQREDARTAVIHFKSAIQAAPSDPEMRFLLGSALLKTGDPVGAAVELQRALDLKYDASKTLPPLARAMLASGQAKRLTELLDGSPLADKTAEASVQASLAAAWRDLDQPAKAAAALEASLKAVPGFPLALVLQARSAGAGGDLVQSHALVDQALKGDPALPEAWNLKGDLLALVPQQRTQAEAMQRKAIEARRNFIPAYVSLVNLKMAAEDLPGARQVGADLRAVLPNHPQTRFIEAQLAYLSGDYAAAKEAAQALLRADPDHVGFLQLSGALEAQAGSLVQAATHFGKAVGINPGYAPARLNLARTQLRLGQSGRAVATLSPLVGPDQDASLEALSLAGDAALQAGDPVQAEALFKRAAAVQPDNERVNTAIAKAELARGDAEGAMSRLEALSRTGREIDAGMALVAARLSMRDEAGALRDIQALQQRHPDKAQVLLLQGRVYIRMRNYAQARASFEQALAMDPSLFAATADLAAIEALERKLDRTEQLLRAAMAADPRNHLAYMTLALLKSRSGADLSEVRTLLAQGIQVSPSEADPRLQLIDVLLRARQFDAALQTAQEAAAALPDDIRIQDALGRAQIQAGQIEQAITTFRRMTGMDEKSGAAHVRLADVLRANGDIPRATASLRRALEVEPGLEEARARLAETLVSDGKGDEALDLARRSRAVDPASPLSYLLEGAIQRRLRKPDAAVAVYRAGLTATKGSPDIALQMYRTLSDARKPAEAERFADDWLKRNPRHAAMHYERGVAAALASNLPLAERHLTAAVEAAPKHPMALNNLAFVLAAQRKPGAVALAQRAVDLLPDRPALMDTLAMALAAEGQLPQALNLQKSAVELAPKDNGLRLNLARLAVQADDKALARQELEKLAALGTAYGLQAEVSRLMKDL